MIGELKLCDQIARNTNISNKQKPHHVRNINRLTIHSILILFLAVIAHIYWVRNWSGLLFVHVSSVTSSVLNMLFPLFFCLQLGIFVPRVTSPSLNFRLERIITVCKQSWGEKYHLSVFRFPHHRLPVLHRSLFLHRCSRVSGHH